MGGRRECLQAGSEGVHCQHPGGCPGPAARGRTHVCRQEGKNTLTSQLQIKQYLWAIVIKGKFNSVLMLHYARLCEVRLGWCRRFNGTGGYGGRNGSPGLSSFSWISAGETGPAAVFPSAQSRECLPFLLGSLWWRQGLPGQLVLMLCPLPALQEGPVPRTVGVGEGGATQEEQAGRGGGPGQRTGAELELCGESPLSPVPRGTLGA